MRQTHEGGYARPASSCQIDPKKVAGFWDAFHNIVAQRHGEECILDGALWEVTWIDGDAKGQVGGVWVPDSRVGPEPSENRYEQFPALFEGLCR